jgi:hypothetical protein
MNPVEALHAELGFDQYAADLRRVAGVWRNLEALQAKARGNKRYLSEYRSYLTRCIKQLQQTEKELQPDEAMKAAEEFGAWVRQRYADLNVAHREASRFPQPWESWCQRHRPVEYKNVCIALNAACERTTQRTVDALRRAYEAMFHAYIGAFDATES